MEKMRLLAVVTACAVAGPVMADSIGPGGTFVPGNEKKGIDGSFGDLFTPPLSASQNTAIPISNHVAFSDSNWAGVHFTVNIDPTEASFMGFIPAQAFNTTGAAGSTTVWSINASNSGQTITNNVPIPLGTLVLHAKGATPMKNNGDIDVVFQNVFNIWHVTSGSVSGSTTFFQSTLVYMPPAVPVSQWGQGTPPQVGDGIWVQLTATLPVHPLNASWFFGTSGFFVPGDSGGIGIENVPAPASVAILIGGFGAFGFARRRRRA